MLYLSPPFHVVHGVSVFGDHADPRQFYYLAAAPHLATRTDASTGVEVPQISLLRFRRDDGGAGGGFLTFTTSLGLGEEALEDLGSEVRRIFDVDGPARLAPAVLERGSVRLQALGSASDGGGSETHPPSDFVMRIDHPATPALYGDNAAVFSVQLDEAGATLIARSLEGEVLPVGVVYELEFVALRPAFNVRVRANWEQMREYLRERSERRVLFWSSEVDEIVDDMLDERVITVEVDDFLPEGTDRDNVVTDPSRVVDEVKDRVLDTFFEPTVPSAPDENGLLDELAATAERLSALAVVGGWAGVGTVRARSTDFSRLDRRRFELDWTERSAVRRRIHPQAHLEGLTRLLRDEGIDRDRFLVDVPLDDPFFRTREVTVVSVADFEGHGIASIAVDLRYGDATRTVTLDADHREERVTWGALHEGGELLRDVAASYTVHFVEVPSGDRPASLTLEKTTIRGNTFAVSPSPDLYRMVPVPVSADEFPWDDYDAVQVDLRYDDADSGIRQRDRLRLDPDQASRVWRWFLLDPDKDTFEYRLVYRAADQRDWTSDWTATRTPDVLVRDPRPQRRTVTIVPAVSWSVVTRVFVDVSYRDDTHGVRSEKSYHFSEGDAEPQRFTVALADPEERRVRYRARLLLRDNSVIEVPPSDTVDNQIFVQERMQGQRVIRVRPDDVDFAANNVREVQVTLRHADEGNGLEHESQLVFTSSGDRALFTFDYVEGDAYRVDALTVFSDGFTAAQPTRTTAADELVVPVA
jgi:hypothetical protein